MIQTLPSCPLLFTARGANPRSSADLTALRHTSERFRLLLENSVDLIVETTRQGEILYVSPNVTQVLGYSVGDLLRLNVFTHVHPEDLAQTMALFALPEGRGTCRYRHKNGAWRWIEATGREFSDAEGRVRSVLIARDITERKEAEAARRHLEEELHKHARLNALGMLAGGIAHDFNNMLTVISLYLGMARADSHEPNVQTSLAQIAEAVTRAKCMARQILTFSRQQSEEYQPVRLPAIVTEVLGFLRPSWPEGVEIVTDLPADGAWIMANPDQIHQVLTNLFLNGAQAMEPGSGRLEVRVRSLVVERPFADPHPYLGSGSYVWLTVSDTGHGMDAATQRQIFEPFFTTKSTSHGTGLGLAIVHRIIKDHGASIRVSSEPGRGTAFQLFFAAQPGPGPANAGESAGTAVPHSA